VNEIRWRGRYGFIHGRILTGLETPFPEAAIFNSQAEAFAWFEREVISLIGPYSLLAWGDALERIWHSLPRTPHIRTARP